jgi:hypothetical protein
MLLIIIVQTTVLVVLIVFGPAYLLKRQSAVALTSRWHLIAFFVSIGLAFMFVEISLIQRMVLYLGSPVYSFAVVVPAILGFAGLGSYLTGRVKGGGAVQLFAAIAVITLWVVAWQVFDPVIGRKLLLADQFGPGGGPAGRRHGRTVPDRDTLPL